jgi:3-methyladenine DNA glycosylase AlkD
LNYDEVILALKSKANPANVAGMARFGITSEGTLGVSIPEIRKLVKDIGRDHLLAERLWKSGIHEARLLAAFIDQVELVTEEQLEDWVKDFDSWDICDQVISNLFDKTPWAYQKAFEWAKREEEFVKRAGFVLMAALAVHDKKATDAEFIKFFPEIKKGATDDRNFVKKAVNWALRQIGKRNLNLNKLSIQTADELLKMDSKSAHWIASDAIRELREKASKLVS